MLFILLYNTLHDILNEHPEKYKSFEDFESPATDPINIDTHHVWHHCLKTKIQKSCGSPLDSLDHASINFEDTIFKASRQSTLIDLYSQRKWLVVYGVRQTVAELYHADHCPAVSLRPQSHNHPQSMRPKTRDVNQEYHRALSIICSNLFQICISSSFPLSKFKFTP